MHRFILFFILSICYCSSTAQLFDDFSDGNLDLNPTWLGDIVSYKVNEELMLQLDHPIEEASVKSLYSILTFPDSLIWSFRFKLNFNPSSNNQLRIYLMADGDPNNIQNAYFIEIGENGNQDGIHFYKKENGIETELINFAVAKMAENPDVFLKITRTKNGSWNFYGDFNNSGIFTLEGELNQLDILPQDCQYFILQSKFTKSNRDRFFFDDISVQELLPDTEEPTLSSHEVIDANSILLHFSEPIEESSAEFVQNYYLSDLGNPVQVTLNPTDPREVFLVFSSSMESGANYELEITNIRDLAGNTISLIFVEFQYLFLEEASAFDLIINEINATTKGNLAVPNVEYVELYNRSSKYFSLQDYSIASGGSPKFLPNVILGPKEYILLCDDDDVILFLSGISIVGISGFPQLTDGGDIIELRNASLEIVDLIIYSKFWHDSENYYEEGYSLERINPHLPCETDQNWASCRAVQGGTPGLANSSLNEHSPSSAFEIIDVIPQNHNEILLQFSHKISGDDGENSQYYSLNPFIEIEDVTFLDENQTDVIVNLSSAMEVGFEYQISIDANIPDCEGMAIDKKLTAKFGIASNPKPGDLLLSEILFNPVSGGKDYVEIYNNSDQFFNLGTLYLGNYDYDPPEMERIDIQKLIFPGEYFAFSENPFITDRQYISLEPNHILAQSLPSFSDKSGNCTLFFGDNGQFIALDSLNYTEDMHNALISDPNGVSLERISFDITTQNQDNWTSASAIQNYGTPGYKNSQFIDPGSEEESSFFWLENKRFSPDQDGFEDLLYLNYQLDKPGYLANIKIYTAEGYHILDLANNVLLDTDGILVWEGQNMENQKAKIGIYLILVKLNHPDGDIIYERHSCILAMKL